MTTEQVGESAVEPRAPGRLAGGRLRLLHYPPGVQPEVRIGRFDLQVQTHLDAVALPLQENAELTRFYGAVYAHDGHLVGASQRGKPGRKYHRNATHLAALPLARAERLSGRTFFAGQLAYQFGHVLLESLTRFWPEIDYTAFDHFVVYPNRQRNDVVKIPELLQQVLALAGIPPERIRAVTSRPLVFDSLDVATAPIRVGSAADPRFLDVFDRVATRVATDHLIDTTALPMRVYLSRSRLDDRRRATNENAIEDFMVARGFVVVHPQEIDLACQVALAAHADVLAGCDGSALHLAAFARPGTLLLALDTRRTPNQFLIDASRRLNAVHAWVLTQPLRDRQSPFSADLGRVEEALALLEDGPQDASTTRTRSHGYPGADEPVG